MTDEPIYLDHQATTPCDPRVVAAMLPYFGAGFGNPHASTHARGRAAAAAVEQARAEVAALIGAEPDEIVFTSGATEANNLAIKGAAHHHRVHPRADRPPRDGVVTLATEHKCVLESARRLGAEGFRVAVLGVRPDGLPDLDALAAAIDQRTAVVSVMAANNEIGTIAPVQEIARLTRAAGALLHTDAAQAAGKIPLDVDSLDVDLASLSAHKLSGPMGIGALYVRRRPRARLLALIDGGAQERGLRSGTLPLPLCVGFGEACRIARLEMAEESARLARLRDRLRAGLAAALPGLALNGAEAPRLPNNLNLAIPGVDAVALLRALPEVALSTGSACTSAVVEPSHVLRALGVSDARARSSIRIAVGRGTTEADVDRAVAAIALAARRLVPGADAQPRAGQVSACDPVPAG